MRVRMSFVVRVARYATMAEDAASLPLEFQGAGIFMNLASLLSLSIW